MACVVPSRWLSFFELPELGELQEDRVGGTDRDDEARQTIEKSSLGHVGLEELRDRLEDELCDRELLVAVAKLFGAEARVAIVGRDLFGEIGKRPMQNRVREALDSSGAHSFVDVPSALPLGASAMVEPKLTIGIPTAVANPPSQIPSEARELVAVALVQSRGSQERLDLTSRFGTEGFIGVERKNPLVLTELGRSLLLSAKAPPLFVVDSGSARFSDFARAIDRSAVDDDDVVCKRHRPNATLDVLGFVQRDDREADSRSIRGVRGRYLRHASKSQDCSALSNSGPGMDAHVSMFYLYQDPSFSSSGGIMFQPSIRSLTRSLKRALSFSAILAIGVGFHAPSAEAYFSTLDTGEMTAPGTFQAMLEPQLVLSRYDGFNVVGRFDQGLDESSSVRAILGFGRVDFQVGAMYKFIPFPDTANQPAIGGLVGATFARVQGETELSVRLHPLISKRFETEIGDLIPFGTIPVGWTSRASETRWPVQIAGGAELRPLDTPNLSYFAELGVNVHQAFSYISAAVAYRFDESPRRRR